MGYASYMGRAGVAAAMRSARRTSAAGFTLAEVLAALLFIGFWPRSLSDPLDQTLRISLSHGEAAPVGVIATK